MGKWKELRVSAFLLLVISIHLFLGGCMNMPCDTKVVNKLTINDEMIKFVISERGSYWGVFQLFKVDHTVAHSNNSMQKFRTEIINLEYVRFTQTAEAEGHLFIKWPGNSSAQCITKISLEHWMEMKRFVANWPGSDKFIQQDK